METKDKPFSALIEMLNQMTSLVLNDFHLGESQRKSATALHFGFILVGAVHIVPGNLSEKHTNSLLLRHTATIGQCS